MLLVPLLKTSLLCQWSVALDLLVTWTGFMKGCVFKGYHHKKQHYMHNSLNSHVEIIINILSCHILQHRVVSTLGLAKWTGFRFHQIDKWGSISAATQKVSVHSWKHMQQHAGTLGQVTPFSVLPVLFLF